MNNTAALLDLLKGASAFRPRLILPLAAAAVALLALLVYPAYAQDGDPPAEPTGLVVSVESGVGVNLTWNDPGDDSITGYEILRRDRKVHGQGVFVSIESDTESADTAYTDATVVADRAYVYRVKAINANGSSVQSSYARADVPKDYEPPEPASVPHSSDSEPTPESLAPSGLTAALADGDVSLNWEAPAEDSESVNNYEVNRRWPLPEDENIVQSNVFNADGTGTAWVDTAVPHAGVRYTYRVRAVRDGVASVWSDEAQVDVPEDAVVGGAQDPVVMPGHATGGEVWSGTLTVADLTSVGPGLVGFSGAIGGLSPSTFSFKGTNYTIEAIYSSSQVLQFAFSTYGLGDEASNLVLVIGANEFDFGDATYSSAFLTYTWTQNLPSWSVGNTPTLKILRIPEAPSEPTDLSARAGDLQATLTWTASDDNGGSDITGHEYRRSDDGGSNWGSWTPITDSAPGDDNETSFTVEDLANGAEYTFQVRAVNAQGESDESNDATATPRREVWSGILTVGVDATESFFGFGAASGGDLSPKTLSFKGTDYTIDAVSRALLQSLLFSFANAGFGDEAANLVLETGNDEFNFGDASYHASSFGYTWTQNVPTWSATDTVALRILRNPEVPAEPTDLSAKAGDFEATLTWTASKDDGGTPITGHEYRRSEDGGSSWGSWTPITDSAPGDDNETSFTVKPLANGTEYTFQVRAVNAQGESDESNDAAATPRLPRRLVWSGTLTVGQITGNTIGFQGGEGDLSPKTFSFKGTTHTIDFVAVHPAGNWLTFSFSGHGLGDEASNLVLEIGQTEFDFGGATYGSNDFHYTWTQNVPSWSVTDTVALKIVRIPEAPGKPKNLTLTPGAVFNTPNILLDWLPPDDDGGIDVTGYRVEVSTDGVDYTVVHDTTGTPGYLHRSLPPAVTLHYRVSAINRAGMGLPSDARNANTPAVAPDPPGDLRAEGGNEEVTLTWTPSPSDGGSPVTRHEYRQSEDGGNWGSWTPITDSAPGDDNATSFTVEELTNDTEYTFQVRAVNAQGESDESIAATATPVDWEEIWSATMTVGQQSGGSGTGFSARYGSLDNPTVSYKGTDHTVYAVTVNATSMVFSFELVGSGFGDSASVLVLEVDGERFPLAQNIPSALGHTAYVWTENLPTWSADDDVALRLLRLPEPEITLTYLETDRSFTVAEEVGTISVGLVARAAGNVKPSEDFQVVVEVSENSTATAGEDYAGFPTTYTFSAGEFQLQNGVYVLTVTHDLVIIDDDITEKTGRLFFEIDTSNLPEHVNVPAGQAEAIVEILDSDVTTVSVVPPDPVEEGEDVVVVVRVDKPVPFGFTILITLRSETALRGEDFPNVPVLAEFNPDDMEIVVRIPTIEDDLDEDNETFSLVWNQHGLDVDILLPDEVLTATILDDDHAPVVETPSSLKTPDHSTEIITLQATDGDGDDLTWKIIDGADRNRFNLTGDGALSFRSRQSYDSPGDSDGDRFYHVTVQVTDGANEVDHPLTIELVRSVTVDNVTRTTAEVTVYALPGNDGETMYLQFGSSHTWSAKRQRTVTDGTAVFRLGGLDAGTRYKVRASHDPRAVRDPAPLRYDDWQRGEFQTQASLVWGPDWLSATPTGDGGYRLTWKPAEVLLPDDVPDITGYRIVRFDLSGRHPQVTLTNNAGGTSYTDPGPLASGQTYYYYIWAMNADGPSSNGATWVKVTPQASDGFGTSPASPRNLDYDRGAPDGQVELRWEAPEDDSATGYVVAVSISGDTRPDGGYRLVELGRTGSTTFTEYLAREDFPNDGHYLRSYRVYAVNDDGLRSWQATVNVPLVAHGCEECSEGVVRPPAPVVESAEIDGDTVVLRFNRDLRHRQPETDGEVQPSNLHFELWIGDERPKYGQVAGYFRTLRSLIPDQYADTFSLSGRVVTLTFAEAVKRCGTVVWVTYAPGDAGGPLDDGTGEGYPVRRFAVQATNNTPAEMVCHEPSRDIAAVSGLRGLHSHGGTLFASHNGTDHIYGYDLTTNSRDQDKDIALASDNTNARGIWSNDETMWVADFEKNKLFAYHLTDGPDHSYGDRDESKEFELHGDNHGPHGIWSNGRTMWVADVFDGKLYAYKMVPAASFGDRDEGKDIALVTENDIPLGLWSDGETMLVAEDVPHRVFAYDLSTKARDEDKELGHHAIGIWSDGEMVWIASTDKTIRAYALPEGFLD